MNRTCELLFFTVISFEVICLGETDGTGCDDQLVLGRWQKVMQDRFFYFPYDSKCLLVTIFFQICAMVFL